MRFEIFLNRPIYVPKASILVVPILISTCVAFCVGSFSGENIPAQRNLLDDNSLASVAWTIGLYLKLTHIFGPYHGYLDVGILRDGHFTFAFSCLFWGAIFVAAWGLLQFCLNLFGASYQIIYSIIFLWRRPGV